MTKWLEHLFSLRQFGGSDPLEKPFLDHLEDLRWMIIKMVAALAFCMIFGIIFRLQLADILQEPLIALEDQVEGGFTLQTLNPVEPIMVTFKLAFYAGLVLAFPFLLYFLAEFILPGLSDKERKMVVPVVLVSFFLFLSGVIFNYFLVLPQTLKFFFIDAGRFGWSQQWSVGMYYSFVTQLSIGFGLAFELPILVLTLVKLGFIDYKLMTRTRPHAAVLFLFLSAVITPTQDILTLMLMAGPMIFLYEMCIWITYFMEKKERERLKAEGLLYDDDHGDDDDDDHGEDDDDTADSDAEDGERATEPENDSDTDEDKR